MQTLAKLIVAAASSIVLTTSAFAQDANAPVPQENVVSVQGDWQVRCGPAENECSMYQLVPVLETRTVKVQEFVTLLENLEADPASTEVEALVAQIKDGSLAQKPVVSRGINADGQSSFRVVEGGDIIVAAQQAEVEDLDVSFSVPMMEVRVVSIKREDNVVAGVTITTPLRTLLTEGLSIQIDTGNVQRYQFALCDPVGCFVRFGLTQNGLDAFKRGNQASVQIVSADRRDAPVNLAVSLKGFTAAIRELQAQSGG